MAYSVQDFDSVGKVGLFVNIFGHNNVTLGDGTGTGYLVGGNEPKNQAEEFMGSTSFFLGCYCRTFQGEVKHLNRGVRNQKFIFVSLNGLDQVGKKASWQVLAGLKPFSWGCIYYELSWLIIDEVLICIWKCHLEWILGFFSFGFSSEWPGLPQKSQEFAVHPHHRSGRGRPQLPGASARRRAGQRLSRNTVLRRSKWAINQLVKLLMNVDDRYLATSVNMC